MIDQPRRPFRHGPIRARTDAIWRLFSWRTLFTGAFAAHAISSGIAASSTYDPAGKLVQGAGGALYGTATLSGLYDAGEIFKINPDGSGFTVLKTFDHQTTGSALYGGVIQGTDGVLYGAAHGGGAGGAGTVFKLNPDGSGFNVLANFESSGGPPSYASTTGGLPYGALIQGRDGALYGTAYGGGTHGWGTVFKLNVDGTGFSVLHHFDSSSTGGSPFAALIQGSDNALYGTTFDGGSSGHGTVFKLNTDGTNFVVLQNLDSATTGGSPYAGLVQATNGALYGTASTGGTSDGGTVFRLNTDGSNFIVLQNLDSATGVEPIAGLIEAAGVNAALYGTASVGGSDGWGTLFKLNPDGTGFSVLHNFDYFTTGSYPSLGGLMQGANSAFYGTANHGGSGDGGTIFRVNADGTSFTTLKEFLSPLGMHIISLAPSSVPSATGDFTLTVNGYLFAPGAVVQWDGADLETTFVNNSRLTAIASNFFTDDDYTALITVKNPDGSISSAHQFSIVAAPRPLKNWQRRTLPNGAQPSFSSVTFGNGRYVAVGNEGTVWYSDGGSTWQAGVSGMTAALIGTVHANNTFVAIGNQVILYSVDGESWTAASAPPDALLLGIAFCKGQFVVLTANGYTLRSTDGIEWIPEVAPAAELLSIAYGNGVYVAVGLGGALFSSPDGLNWTDQSPAVLPAGPPGDLLAVGFDAGRFVAVGRRRGAPTVFTSANGLDWTARALPLDNSDTLYGLTFLEGHVVVASDYIILSSPDCVMWKVGLTGEGTWRALATGAGTVLAVGSDSAIAQSGPGIGSFNPASIAGGSPTITLTVKGEAFVNGAAVIWDGEPLSTTFVSDTQVTAEVSAARLPVTADLLTVSVMVKNPDGATSFEKAFAITAANITTIESVIAGAGVTATVSIAPTASNGAASGVSATLANSGDPTPVTVSAASYSSNPSPSTAFDVAGSSELAGNFLDLQVTGADLADQLAASFYYPLTVTGAAEEELALKYYNGSGWAPVLSSGGTAPAKNSTDNLNDTISGGSFVVYFDDSSSPRITELNGTFFAASIPRGPLAFAGFLPPIGGADASGGSFAHPVRTFKGGSTIPVKFSVARDGAAIVTGVHTLQATHYSSETTTGTPIDASPQGGATTGNQFVLHGSEWHFNLDTKATGLSTGIWQLVATLSDGTEHRVWIQIK